MKTINATLTTNQKIPYGIPIASATLADAGKLHPVQLFDAADTGDIVAACKASSSFNRCRAGASGVYRQRITDPATESQWSTWTQVTATAAKSGVAPAIFYTTTHVVIAWQNNANGDIRYIRSADDGVTWGAVTTAFFGMALAELGGVSGTATVSGLILTQSSQLYWFAYNSSTDTWSALVSAGITMLSTNAPCDASYDTVGPRLIVCYCPVEVTGLYRLKFLTYNFATWSAARTFHEASDENGVGSATISQAKISGYWWLAFRRQKEWGGKRYFIGASDDGLAFEDFFAVNANTDATRELTVIGDLAGFTWLATERSILRSSAQSFWSSVTVKAYKLTARLSAPADLVVDVDNRAGTLAEPTLFSKLTLDRGLRIDGLDYTVGLGSFFVTGFRYLLQENILRVEATDALGLLESWVPDQTSLFTGERIDKLVELVCALAGVHVVAFDAASVWAETFTPFAVHAGQSGLTALRELQARASFEVLSKEDGSLSFFVPTASPSAGYTYGTLATEHYHWIGAFGRAWADNHLFVAGLFDPAIARQYGAESLDLTIQGSAARRAADYLRDDRLTTNALAQSLADSRLVLAKENKRAGDISAPPSFSLEPGDVIAMGQAWPNTNGPWRVQQFVEGYNQPGWRKFLQRLTLRGTA